MADEALQGVQAFNAREQESQLRMLDERRNLAYNALAKVYGPVAGDPATAQALQTLDQGAQEFPGKLKAQELANTGAGLNNQQTTQAIDQSNQLQPGKVQAQGIENAQGQQTLDQGAAAFPGKLQAQTLANQGQSIANATGQNTLNTQQASQQRAATAGIMSALTTAAQNGGDVGAVFDQYAPVIAQMEGVDKAHLQPLRAMLVKDPIGTINNIQQALAAQQQQNNPQRTTAAAAAKNSPQANAEKAGALQTIRERTGAVPDALDQALALIPQMSNTAVIRKAQENYPGSPEYKFHQLAQQIGSNLSLDDLRAVRTSGLSLGRTNIAEFTASSHAFANNDLGQDPRMIASNLQRLKRSYAQINSNLDSDIKRLQGGGAIAQPQDLGNNGVTEQHASAVVKALGGTINSTYRDPQHNKDVGGVPNSLHARGGGEAMDFNLPKDMTADQFKARIQAAGYPITEWKLYKKGNDHHVHWGWGNKTGAAAPASDTDLLKKYGVN